MRIISAVHPSDNQKRVLAKIAASATPKVAGEELSNDANIVAARNMLMKLGLITFSNGEAAFTEQGTRVAQDENILDQTGQLTPTGKALAYSTPGGAEDPNAEGNTGDGAPPPEMGQEPPPPQEPEEDASLGDPNAEPALETFKLLKQMLR